MQAELCDFCMKPMEYQRSLTGGTKLQYIVRIKQYEEGHTLAGYFRKTRTLDMCPECMNKFKEFVKKETAVK